MKIENGYNKFLQSIQHSQKQQPSKKVQQQAETTREEKVQVTISEEAKRLSETSQKSEHSQRVEDIKAAIQNNTYEVSPEEISKGLMRSIQQQKGNK